MRDIPAELRELADKLAQISPIPFAEGDDSEFVSPILEMLFGTVGLEQIYDWLQYHKSVDFASAFKERFEALKDLAQSPIPDQAGLGLLLKARGLADYCRDLATEIEGEPTQETGMGQGTGAQRAVDHHNSWEPPEDHVRVSAIQADEEYQKNGKNPSRTTIQQWENRDHPLVVRDPATNESCFLKSWVFDCIKKWNPRK
ncbi:MAG: hypothetical protein IIA66_12365 [Planctomycetes bacterium]|nr:hypothetical protein [Planctomycetota bacterium]